MEHKMVQPRQTLLSRKRRHPSRQGAGTSHDGDDMPPRSRLRQSRLTGRTSSSSVEILDIPPQAITPPIAEIETIDLSATVCVVDLTDDTEPPRNRSCRNASQDDIVDLTVERAPRRRRRSRRVRPMRNSQRSNIIPILSDSDEENDIMVLPEIDLGNSYRTAREEASNSTVVPTRPRQTSPQKRVITCPICMDDETTLRNNGQQLMSTNCGHVFCRRCIRASIQSQQRCPTCRKKLTLRQIHPIFL